MSTISPVLKAANYRDNSALRRMKNGWSGRAKKMTIVARTNVGFEEAEWHWICDMAHQTDCTVSEIIREVVREAYKRALSGDD